MTALAPTRANETVLAQAYLRAKREILKSPYNMEIVATQGEPNAISESDFLREIAWVILSAGIAEAVVRRKFPVISSAFLDWQSAQDIVDKADQCVADALEYFRHPGKIGAIASAAKILVTAHSFDDFKQLLLQDPINELQRFPYIGPTTAFHIAKNIGLKFSKPDRHLVRLAQHSGYESVADFCTTIAGFLGEDIRLVDTVLWRFATLHKDYCQRFLASDLSPSS